jgi:hypothetical protein
MFPFGFQFLVIIYINFKLNSNYIKHYIQLVGKVKDRGTYYFLNEVLFSKEIR